MKEAVVSFVLALLLVVVAGQSDVCNNACIVGTVDTIQLPSYGPYTFPYIHSPDRPPLVSPQSNTITTGIIVLHGDAGDANDYYCWMTWAVETASNLNSTYIVAPHFMLLSDNPPSNGMYWDAGSSWMNGGKTSTTQTPRTASYQIIEDIMTIFANKTLFPNLNNILLIGHSAGGQTGQRYALVSNFDSTLASAGISIRYIFANPGTYAYLDDRRPVLATPPANNCTGYCDGATIPTATYTYAVPASAANCSTYNNWKYGLDDRSVDSWTNQISAATAQTNYQSKNITYMLGTNDTCNNQFGSCGCDDVTLDNGCEADFQGYCRFQRGTAFYNYLQQFYGTQVHTLVNVAGIGHDGCNMFNGPTGLSTIFQVPISSLPTEAPTPAPTSAPTPAPTSAPSTTGSGSSVPTINPEQCEAACIIGDVDEFHMPAYGPFSLPYIHSPQRTSVQSPQNDSITTGILVLHGDDRDANDYYCWMTWVVQAASNLESVYVLAPHYQILSDNPLSTEMYWDADSAWMDGGKSSTAQSTRTASFQIIDDFVSTFANKTLFPGLTEILLVGHSAGAQTLQRYALVSTLNISSLGVSVRFVLANAGSYGYLDERRPVYATPTADVCSGFCDSETIPTFNYQFVAPSTDVVSNCSTYNNWKYGLTDRSVDSWTNRITSPQVAANYIGKNITYMLGTNDTCNNQFGSCGCDDSGLDAGCEGDMQGFCRYQRGWAFFHYLQMFYNQSCHSIVTVPGVGHDACNMFLSFQAFNVLFGTPIPSTTATIGSATTGGSVGSATTGAVVGSTTGSSTTGPVVIPPLPTCNATCTSQAASFKMPSYKSFTFPYFHSPSQPALLSVQDAAITTGIIVIHGENRDASNYFCYLTDAVESGFNSASSYVVAPQYFLLADDPATNVMYWDANTAWQNGGKSTTAQSTRVASYQIIDDMITTFANKTLFPGLTQVLVVGDSMGGSFVQRYAAVSTIDSSVSISIRYVASNPGSYAYLDDTRPVITASQTCAGYCDASSIPTANYTFAVPSTFSCADYNEWEYGLDDRSVDSYTNKLTAPQVGTNFQNKTVTYLLGTADTCNEQFGCGCNDSDLDVGCEASLQGNCRFQRGWAFYNHLKNYYNTTVHAIANVAGVGHVPCQMFSSATALSVLFPIPQEPQCTATCSVQTSSFQMPAYKAFTFPYVHSSSQPAINAAQSASITTGIIIIHDESRNAANYYCYMANAVQLGFNPASSYIVAPRFLLLSDGPGTNVMYWDANTAWQNGGKSTTAQSTRTASYQIIDDMITTFANKTLYPGLTQVLVVGDSMGGGFVQRYAAVSIIDTTAASLGISIRYVASNPNSYAYLDNTRPVQTAAATCDGYCDPTVIPTATYTFAVPSTSCSDYNDWEYGLDDRSVDSYTNKLTAPQVGTNFQNKSVTYLLGTSDTCNEQFSCGCNDVNLDVGCEATLQGNCRFQRGWAFYNHLKNFYGFAVQSIANVPLVGHVPCQMLSSPTALAVFFPPVPATTAAATTAAATTAAATTAATTAAATTAAATTAATTAAATTAATTAAATTAATTAAATTAATTAAATTAATTAAATTAAATTAAATTAATTAAATTAAATTATTKVGTTGSSTSTTGVPTLPPNPCVSSITISQSFVSGWSSGSTSFSEWNVIVSTTTEPLYAIDLLFTFAPGASFDGFWEIQQVSGNVYTIIDWHLIAGIAVPPNTQMNFGYIVTSSTAATISVASARCTSAIEDCHVSSSLSLVSSSNSTCGELQQNYQFYFTNLGTSTTSEVQVQVTFPAHSRPSATTGLVTSDSASVIILNGQTTFAAPLSLAPGNTATVGFTLSVPTYNSLLPGYASIPTYQVVSTTCA